MNRPVLVDARGRALRDLRISITDRCNFRCTYCMPRAAFGRGHAFLPRGELLSFEEIARLARIFAGLGVRKLRLTGGEPLLRKNVAALVGQLAAIGGLDLALTTNAALLPQYAAALKTAGLNRVTVSLDALDEAVFAAISDAGVPVARVLEGIAAAAAAGLAPLKINMVVRRGVNDSQIVPMAQRFRGTGHIVRFIEYMDVGATNGWRMEDVLPAAETIRRIHAVFPLEPVPAAYPGEVARRWRYCDGGGEIGIVASVTAPFCGDCTRLRLSTEGRLYACLFATEGFDLRARLRGGAADADIAAAIADFWRQRDDRYSEIRGAAATATERIEMSYIGG